MSSSFEDLSEKRVSTRSLFEMLQQLLTAAEDFKEDPTSEEATEALDVAIELAYNVLDD